MSTTAINPEHLRQAAAEAFSQSNFELAISPTEHCNFRCTYCFESFEHGRMSLRTITALKKLISTRIPDLRSFQLHWYGGEPLMAKELVLELSKYSYDLCKEHDTIFSPGTMSTNAWHLDQTTLRDLVDTGISVFQVSLDGEAEVHNKTRRQANHRGTFDRVYENLLNARKVVGNFDMRLRLHLHGENLESQARLVKTLREDFGNDERFTVHPISVGDFGGATIGEIKFADTNDRKQVEQYIRQAFREPKPKVKSNVPFVCYAAKQNHFFIRADGRIAKCTSAMNMADNHIGHLSDEGDMIIDWDKSLKWSFGFKTGGHGDLACPLHHMPDTESKPITLVRMTPSTKVTA